MESPARCAGAPRPAPFRVVLCMSAMVLTPTVVWSQTPAPSSHRISFDNIAASPASGLVYERTPSPREAIFDTLRQQPTYSIPDIVVTPLKGHGSPGVAVIDFDGDGDQDLYVTNGPGTPNSLFENRLRPTGRLTFRDVAVPRGAALTDQDSSGVCFGDTDNDGDPDLLVLGSGEPNRLLENRGGQFVDATTRSNGSQVSEIGGGNRWSTTCSFGDVNADGLLDVVVSNTFTDWRQQAAIMTEPFSQNEHNQLFLNRGGNVFEDVSAAAGLELLAGVPPGAATISWAIAIVDLDGDGDQDILHGDDQAAVPYAKYGGLDRGFLQTFANDGTGQLTNVTPSAGTLTSGQWMGLSFGDLDCDGDVDFFGSNLGDYMLTLLPLPSALGDSASRWFLNNGDGTFADPGVGELVSTPFGWGTSMIDYDNDADLDIVFYGGLEPGPFIEASNPGTILENHGCQARFTRAADALRMDHGRRSVEGLATGDLNLDGFSDIVSVSGHDSPEPLPLIGHPVTYGGAFDAPVARIVPTFTPIGPTTFVWAGLKPTNGTLAVEINRARNNYRSVTVELVGGVGLTPAGRVNRSGIGGLVAVTPRRGEPVSRPVLGGASYGSQDSLAQTLGLGHENRGTVDVTWPGGVRNRLYDVRSGEHVQFPEIPCSFTATWPSRGAYTSCVREALDDFVRAGEITRDDRARFLSSALRAFSEAH